MPLYEYRCNDCGKEFEIIQKFSDEVLKECIYCSGRVERLISQSSFILKGSGWYLTDYARKDRSGSDRSKDTKNNKPECATCTSTCDT